MADSVTPGLTGLPLARVALSPLLLVNNPGMSIMDYALWQLPTFCSLIVGDIVLNFIAAKSRVGRLLYFPSFPVFAGLALGLIMTLLFDNIIALVIGMMIYTFGVDFFNAILYRITLFPSVHGKEQVFAMPGMDSVAIFVLAGSLLAAPGAIFLILSNK